MKQEKYRRRYLVDKRYQLTQAGVAIAANILVVLLMATLMSWFYLFYLDNVVVCDHNRLFPLYLGVTMVLVVFLSTLMSLRRSRAVAGMIRKLDSVLRDAAAGKFPDSPLVFRKGDCFGWLAHPLNLCFIRLKWQRNAQDRAISSLRELKDRIDSQGVNREKIVQDLDGIITGLMLIEGTAKDD